MTFSIHIPQYPLSQFIDCLWYANEQITYRREKILPTATVELMVNFGTPFKLIDHDDAARYNLNTHGWIVGMQNAYLINEPVGETHTMGIRFKPGGVYPFFHFPVAELTDNTVQMDLIWGRFLDDVRTQLYEVQGVAAQFRLLETILLQQMQADMIELRPVQYAVQQITHAHGALSIHDLSHQVGLSHKHLIHQFKKLVGLSPKAFARIIKFQYVLHSINPAQPINWADIAHQHQYYDQAHFNKDFVRFTGLTPSDYIRLRHEFLGDVQQGEAVHFVPIE